MQSQLFHWNHQKIKTKQYTDEAMSQAASCGWISVITYFSRVQRQGRNPVAFVQKWVQIFPQILELKCVASSTKECIMLILRQYNMLAISISLQSGTAIGADQQGKGGCAPHSITFHLLMREDRLIPWVLPVRILVCMCVDTVTINAPPICLWDKIGNRRVLCRKA